MLKLPWLSSLLLALANVAFASFLGRRGENFSLWYRVSDLSVWYFAIAYAVVQAALLSIGWKFFRRLLLLGFKSDVGYSVMALASASLAVVLAVWLQTVAYFLVMLAAALLLRVELLTRGIGNGLAFVTLVLVSWLGLGAGWLTLAMMTESHLLQPL